MRTNEEIMLDAIRIKKIAEDESIMSFDKLAEVAKLSISQIEKSLKKAEMYKSIKESFKEKRRKEKAESRKSVNDTAQVTVDERVEEKTNVQEKIVLDEIVVRGYVNRTVFLGMSLAIIKQDGEVVWNTTYKPYKLEDSDCIFILTRRFSRVKIQLVKITNAISSQGQILKEFGVGLYGEKRIRLSRKLFGKNNKELLQFANSFMEIQKSF